MLCGAIWWHGRLISHYNTRGVTARRCWPGVDRGSDLRGDERYLTKQERGTAWLFPFMHDYCFLPCRWPQVINLFPSKVSFHSWLLFSSMHVALGDRFVSFKAGGDRRDGGFLFYRAREARWKWAGIARWRQSDDPNECRTIPLS
jgi:hypothetical protein